MPGLLRRALRNVPILEKLVVPLSSENPASSGAAGYPIEFACFDGRAQRTKLRRGLSSTSGWLRWFSCSLLTAATGEGRGGTVSDSAPNFGRTVRPERAHLDRSWPSAS